MGGDIYRNEQQLLPTSDGRVWFEADVEINNQISRNKQLGTRLLYSNDGLLFITTDHYKSFKEIGKWK
ncbi:ribonuclease domain-containing protein [uncultured Haemophilus sp.]|uniref:ribonuclease domain-containing protein n=1 Tax=uncultured Haemophilus sp. TaxID=237779 RepID=UPI00343A40C0